MPLQILRRFRSSSAVPPTQARLALPTVGGGLRTWLQKYVNVHRLPRAGLHSRAVLPWPAASSREWKGAD